MKQANALRLSVFCANRDKCSKNQSDISMAMYHFWINGVRLTMYEVCVLG